MHNTFDDSIKKALSTDDAHPPLGHEARFKARIEPPKRSQGGRLLYLFAAAAVAAAVALVWFIPTQPVGTEGVAPIHSLQFVRGSEIVLGKLDSAKTDPLLASFSPPEIDSALLRLEAEEGRLYRLWLQTGHTSVEEAILSNYDQQLRLVERSRTIARMTAERQTPSSIPN